MTTRKNVSFGTSETLEVEIVFDAVASTDDELFVAVTRSVRKAEFQKCTEIRRRHLPIHPTLERDVSSSFQLTQKDSSDRRRTHVAPPYTILYIISI